MSTPASWQGIPGSIVNKIMGGRHQPQLLPRVLRKTQTQQFRKIARRSTSGDLTRYPLRRLSTTTESPSGCPHPTRRLDPIQYGSRSLRRKTLPTAVLGISSTRSRDSGFL